MIGAYPYDFFNVVKYGYTAVLINVVGIAVLGLVISFIYMGIDRLLQRRASSAPSV